MAINLRSTENLSRVFIGDKVRVLREWGPNGGPSNLPVITCTVTNIRLNTYNDQIWMADLEYNGAPIGSAALASLAPVEEDVDNLKELVWE